MLHSIAPDAHGPLTAPMQHAVEACVHCGFCLAACPTYRELGQEMDSPRGRIVLMKEVLERKLDWPAAQPHIDRCLGCLACEPACPSGVSYRDLISPFRTLASRQIRRTTAFKLRHFVAAQTLPFPTRFRIAAQVARLGKRFTGLLPPTLRPMLDLLPARLPPAQSWPALTPAQGHRRARVALLLGCVQRVLEPDINTATISVLTRNGVEVVLPQNQCCCGALAWHTGDLSTAQKFARHNLQAFPSDIDAILTNAAGCGSALLEYPLILRGTPFQAQAETFRRRVLDVSRFLAQLGLREPNAAPAVRHRIAYHDACHLVNAQNVRAEPRTLLRSIPGLELCELSDPHLCCGSAGTYNLDQPLIAASLGRQKAQAALATGANLIATGNIGCLIQLRSHLARLGSPVPVRHTMQVLRDAYH